MRIGIFTDSYVPRPDGIAIAVDTMRQALKEAGHEVFVFCPARPGVSYNDAHVITYPSVPALIYEGLRAAWPFGRGKLERIEELRLDVIHIHLPFMMGFAGLRAAKKLGLPVVMSCHQDMDYVRDYKGAFLLGGLILLPTALISGRYKDALKTLFAPRRDPGLPRRHDLVRRSYCFLTDSCDAAIAPSRKVFEQLRNYSKTRNFVVVPNVVNPADLPEHLPKARARRLLGIDPKTRILITTSRLVREKKIEEAIDGFARLHKKRPDTELYILGDGPCRSLLEDKVAQLHLEACVKFCGWQPHSKVFNYLSAADIYINACQREIMSLSALEAGAMAKPLLLFDNRLVELLDDGRNGFFVRDNNDMAKMARLIISDNRLMYKMGKASRRLVLDNYNLTSHAKGLTSVYLSVAAE